MKLEVAAIEEQVVEGDAERSRHRQASNSTLMASQIRLTVDLDSATSDPRASARAASTSRTDRPRTKLAITSDSKALVRQTPVPSSREAKASSHPRLLGTAKRWSPIWF